MFSLLTPEKSVRSGPDFRQINQLAGSAAHPL